MRDATRRRRYVLRTGRVVRAAMPAPSETPSESSLAAPAVQAREPELPGLWRLTWPLFISLSLSLSLIFCDAFFLSRISDAAAGAAGALNPVLSATIVVFVAVGQAGASVAGRLHGARRHDELPATYLALLGFNFAAGIAVSGLLFLLHPYLPGGLPVLGCIYASGVRTEQSDAMFLAMARRSCAAIRDLRSLDLL